MAKLTQIKRSFNAGELDERMDSRADQAKYAAGCKTMENFIPQIYGGAEQRPGTEFIAAAKSSVAADKSNLIEFEHSVDDTYVLEFFNQGIRVFKDGARVTGSTGENTSSFPQQGSLEAQWKLNEVTGTSIADSVSSHTGTLSVDASGVTVVGQINTAIDFANAYHIDVPDDIGLSFISGGVDAPFTIASWIKYTDRGLEQTIISKEDNTTGSQVREWRLYVTGGNKVVLRLWDDSVGASGVNSFRTTDAAIAETTQFITVTYDGRGGNDAADGITIYIDGSPVASTATNSGTYVDMEDTAAPVIIGADEEFDGNPGNIFNDELDNIIVWNGAELTSGEVTALYGLQTGTETYEIESPYLTADLFDLKFEQSADVMFITHPSYEPRRLSRLGDAAWALEVANLQTGPFRDQNTDTARTISASGTTGSVTLTASAHAPFVAGTTAGHSPSGSSATSKSTTGALFKLIHATNTPSVGETLDSTTVDDATTTLVVPKGVTWDFTTNGTWGTGGPSTIVLERSYDNEVTYETVHTVTSLANKNTITSGTEDVDDALYRARVTDGTGTGNASIQLSIRDTSHIGIVQITSVTSGTVAVGTVVQTLGSTDPTHRWSEGSFSNRRSWPIDVTISAEERLTFTGNVSEPLTIWGSFIGDFTDFALGTDDDAAIQFTLVGSGQQNRIRWTVAKDAMILGTNGGEHLLGASKNEEALTPTNVKAKLQTTYGSENVAAKIVNQAILFVQRGGKKIREFLYNFEADAHKADDLTVFAGQVTGDGIVDMAFQRTPDPILWCVRTDGQLAIMNYERDQNVFSWARMFTTDSTANSVIESVAVIYGGTRSEDEVWVSILRQINGSDSRTIERFAPRELPSSPSDWKFLDSYITDTGGDTTIEVPHLIGETVQILGDGLVQGTKVVSGGGTVTADTVAAKYQVGLGYTATIVPMNIDLQGQGLAATTRINKTYVNVHDTVGLKIGPDTSNLKDVVTGTALVTDFRAVSIPGGYARDTDVTIQQTQPLPATVLGLTHAIGGSND